MDRMSILWEWHTYEFAFWIFAAALGFRLSAMPALCGECAASVARWHFMWSVSKQISNDVGHRYRQHPLIGTEFSPFVVRKNKTTEASLHVVGWPNVSRFWVTRACSSFTCTKGDTACTDDINYINLYDLLASALIELRRGAKSEHTVSRGVADDK